ncbi:MAG: hypothetical protein ACOCP8_02360 [archaeon]
MFKILLPYEYYDEYYNTFVDLKKPLDNIATDYISNVILDGKSDKIFKNISEKYESIANSILSSDEMKNLYLVFKGGNIYNLYVKYFINEYIADRQYRINLFQNNEIVKKIKKKSDYDFSLIYDWMHPRNKDANSENIYKNNACKYYNLIENLEDIAEGILNENRKMMITEPEFDKSIPYNIPQQEQTELKDLYNETLQSVLMSKEKGDEYNKIEDNFKKLKEYNNFINLDNLDVVGIKYANFIYKDPDFERDCNVDNSNVNKTSCVCSLDDIARLLDEQQYKQIPDTYINILNLLKQEKSKIDNGVNNPDSDFSINYSSIDYNEYLDNKKEVKENIEHIYKYNPEIYEKINSLSKKYNDIESAIKNDLKYEQGRFISGLPNHKDIVDNGYQKGKKYINGVYTVRGIQNAYIPTDKIYLIDQLNRPIYIANSVPFENIKNSPIKSKKIEFKSNNSQIIISKNKTLRFSENDKHIEFNLVRSKISFMIFVKLNIPILGYKYVYFKSRGELLDVSIVLMNDYKGLINEYYRENRDPTTGDLTDVYGTFSKYENIRFYNLKTLIHDYIYMLFENKLDPWNTNKYEKRIMRYLMILYMNYIINNTDRTKTICIVYARKINNIKHYINDIIDEMKNIESILYKCEVDDFKENYNKIVDKINSLHDYVRNEPMFKHYIRLFDILNKKFTKNNIKYDILFNLHDIISYLKRINDTVDVILEINKEVDPSIVQSKFEDITL